MRSSGFHDWKASWIKKQRGQASKPNVSVSTAGLSTSNRLALRFTSYNTHDTLSLYIHHHVAIIGSLTER